jgi:hypothetical protein
MPCATIEQWTEYIQQGRADKKLKPPDPKLQNLIALLFEPAPDRVKQVSLVCGRGRGKSFITIFIATMALSLSGNEIGLFLEPDWKRVRRVFLKKWQQIVSPKLYSHNKTEQCITWLPTGSLLFYGPRNITGAKGTADDSQLGQDTTFIIDDEAALRCSYDMYINNLATIREPSDVRFYLLVSTPRVGPFRRLVNSEGHIMFRGKSTDNPYRPEGYVRNLRKNMSRQTALRELDGEFVSLEGRIWPDAKLSMNPKDHDYKDCAWPNGNRDDEWTCFNPKAPYWLFCDLGAATASYVVCQQRSATYHGHRLFNGNVWVAVADLCPHSDASASRAFQKIKAEFGIPRGVSAGADVNTRAQTDGRTVAYFVDSVFGSTVRIFPCNEGIYNKQHQYDVLSYLICSATGQRRFTIARDFVSLDTDSHRGVVEMIHEDEMPPIEQRREGDVLPKGKDNIVQHTRDALLMGAASIMSPPEWAFGRSPAMQRRDN